MRVDVKKCERRKSDHLIFVSAGNRETFASYAMKHLSDRYDVAVFYYGAEGGKERELMDGVRIFATGEGTKFNALKGLHQSCPELLRGYKSVWVCDDDLVPLPGGVDLLFALIGNFGLKVLSPAHASEGKVSHEIMRPMAGRHVFRYVNFVEMTWPLFESSALADFLDSYDGSLAGWGMDWWFLNYLKADKFPVAAVVDAVQTLNPLDHMKPGGNREIDAYASTQQRYNEWVQVKALRGLNEWQHMNLFTVYRC